MENDHLNDALLFMLAAQTALQSNNMYAVGWRIQQAIEEIKKEMAKQSKDPTNG